MTLIKQLEGAKYTQVEEFEGEEYIWAWHGGHGVYCYNEDGEEVAFANTGDFANKHATIEEVKKRIEEVKAGNIFQPFHV